ncbi:MAG: hypothetical protein WC179_08710 [Candidatus Cloacimonadaceae bacterium]
MNFKEINGEVFYYIEPTYIDINTKTPLLVRYYQGMSRMGLLNADLVSEQELSEERIVDKIINGKIAMYRNSNKGDNIHRLEMVGKHVPAESPLWWQYQMSIGKNAEIAQLKKDKLELKAQCFHKDETISVLKNRIAELEFDNRSLVEQVNQMVMRMEHKSGTAQRRQG